MRPHAQLISVVDDDASIRQALAGLFRSVGSPVATFATAEEFLRSDRPGTSACRNVDVIFANAGVAQLAPVGTVEENFFDGHFGANVKGLFFSVQKGLPFLNDGGVIVLTGSIADIKGFPAMSVYGATKAAVRSFARTWTNELRDRHIRVNVISPGHIDTPIMESVQQGDALTRMKEEFARAVPLGRMGDPDEIPKAVSFLASDEASYVSGIELFVDGGVAQI